METRPLEKLDNESKDEFLQACNNFASRNALLSRILDQIIYNGGNSTLFLKNATIHAKNAKDGIAMFSIILKACRGTGQTDAMRTFMNWATMQQEEDESLASAFCRFSAIDSEF